jgi:hypothetical protein
MPPVHVLGDVAQHSSSATTVPHAAVKWSVQCRLGSLPARLKAALQPLPVTSKTTSPRGANVRVASDWEVATLI